MKPSEKLFLERKQYGRLGVHVREATRKARGMGRALHPRGTLVAPLTYTPSLRDCFRSKNNSPEGFIPFGLRLIFLFCETVKQGKKQKLALGSWSIG